MEVLIQTLDDVLDSLQLLTVDWQDDISRRVIGEIEKLPIKAAYTAADIQQLLDKHFDDGLLIFRLFLGLSKDQFSDVLRAALGVTSTGIKQYKKDRAAYVDALVSLGLLDAISEQMNRAPKWSDVLVERLRSGRGSAISGQKRGRGVEDFAETIVRTVFGDNFSARCNFEGPGGKAAKCDFAIPSKTSPRILIESKGYGATGSKMTDVIGDIEKIIAAKRPDTAFLFFTDGLTWKQRRSDLRKVIEYQNHGQITRIYTMSMADRFEADLRQLKGEAGL